MDITLISKQNNLIRVVPARSHIVEYYRDPARKDLIYIQVYNPVKNTCYEVAPDIRKSDYITIVNCIWDSNEIFFADFELSDKGSLTIHIYRHSIETCTTALICSFVRKMEVLNENIKLKLFVLNESTILMQTETLYKNISETRMGSIEFALSLYHLDTESETQVAETNLTNNGINTIIPVSESKIMVKTGYSYLDDPRLDSANESESFIESVYVTTAAKLIADITLARNIMDMPLIDSVYRNSHITKPFITGDILHYSIADVQNQAMKCVFYNIQTEERTDYTVVGFSPEDLNITYVIGNTPFVRMTTDNGVSFLNLKIEETDIVFYNERFLGLEGEILILETLDKHPRMHIYSYPKLKLLSEDDREYECSCIVDNKCYIYC